MCSGVRVRVVGLPARRLTTGERIAVIRSFSDECCQGLLTTEGPLEFALFRVGVEDFR